MGKLDLTSETFRQDFLIVVNSYCQKPKDELFKDYEAKKEEAIEFAAIKAALSIQKNERLQSELKQNVGNIVDVDASKKKNVRIQPNLLRFLPNASIRELLSAGENVNEIDNILGESSLSEEHKKTREKEDLEYLESLGDLTGNFNVIFAEHVGEYPTNIKLIEYALKPEGKFLNDDDKEEFKRKFNKIFIKNMSNVPDCVKLLNWLARVDMKGNECKIPVPLTSKQVAALKQGELGEIYRRYERFAIFRNQYQEFDKVEKQENARVISQFSIRQ